MRIFFKNKLFRIVYLSVLYLFAAYGAVLFLTYVAMRLNWTNDAGMVDANNRYFQEMHDKYNRNFKVDSVSMQKHRFELLNRILVLNDFYPQNAQMVLSAFQSTGDEKLALRMLDAVDQRLMNNTAYKLALQKMQVGINDRSAQLTGLSVFEWMNIEEWKYFKEAVTRDKKWIDSAARVTGVEGRYIVACLVGEQVRLFNSRRQRFKNFIAPLKNLVLETNLSYGVTGIKEHTAIRIENYLKDSSSVYYLGPEFAHLLDYDTAVNYTNGLNHGKSLRLRRLVQYHNHYYSYLYAAIFIKQIKMQWQRAGYPIDDRPEILASLFNLGYAKSVPKKNPSVGGSVFRVRDRQCTFGSVAYDFYYSGELQDVFPFEKKHFDWLPK
ncbi:MAG: hypothetical protein ACK45H_05275 [Bacteroidota bacterium]|jgi:hypothetical protein